ncbi:MAG TPA: C39 family peptidase [Patescibacteria group bacterium]|jgi:uncharacterized protein YvpB|nr:C39 family peptidase [Patescibacteria group bacterium]
MTTLKQKANILIITAISITSIAGFQFARAQSLPSNVLLQVPFSTQAPLGEWNDSRQQDGCEEVTIVMAWMWAQGINLTPDQIRNDITGMSDYEQYFYGYYRDSSAEDTAKLMTNYFGYQNVTVRHDINLTDIKSALAANELVITPINPRIISTVNYNRYTINHTVVVVGYDENNIIIHDPLHDWGSNLRIPQATFEKALADYPSGQRHVASKQRGKSMIVISKAK